jgi:hypothetical protein
MGFLGKLLNLLKTVFGLNDFEYGSFVVSGSTRQELLVSTSGQPTKVWLSASPCGDLPVCGADVDFVSDPQIVTGGFVVTVLANSGCCKVDWFVAE